MKPTTRTRTRSRFAGILVAAILGLAGAIVPMVTAHAADGPFTIDGVVPDAGATELSDPSGNVKELGPKNASTTKIGVIHNAATPMLDATNPNAQVDLRRAWLTTARDSSTQHDWLYFAWERDSNSGSGFIAYEFMQNPAPAACAYGTATDAQLTASCNPWKNRTAGDFMIRWDQSGGSTALVKRTWTLSGSTLVLGAGVPLTAAVSQAAYSADGFRGEAAVDLTATVFNGSIQCRTFANTIPSTVTGNSDSADYKDTILRQAPPITNCTSSVVTTPKQADGTTNIPAVGLSIGTGVVGVRDSAVVDLSGGSGTPAGSVAFSLCKVDSPATCSSGGTAVGSTNLPGTSYPATVVSPLAYVTSTGRYCWRSEFSGDTSSGIPASGDSSASQCFTVNAVTPTLSTSASADVLVGSTVSDSAGLSGTATQPATPVINLTGDAGPAAGGTITFKLYGPSSSGCGALVQTMPTVSVSGDDTYHTPAPQVSPSAPGNYHWVAVYSGSPNTNGTTHNAACDDTSEDVTVSTVPSSLSSAQSWVPNDSVTVSATAGGNLVGTVYFDLYASDDCSGTALYTVSRSVSGASPQTVGTANTVAATATGHYSWKVRYDSTNSAQDDIGASCHETSALTVTNGGTISSP